MYYLSKHAKESDIIDALVELVSGNLELFDEIDNSIEEQVFVEPPEKAVWTELYNLAHMLAAIRDRKEHETPIEESEESKDG